MSQLNAQASLQSSHDRGTDRVDSLQCELIIPSTVSEDSISCVFIVSYYFPFFEFQSHLSWTFVLWRH
ncbi:unnamed protein product [Leptidea sinapis]|uniref:Uncharacterized protein n=1 Tax=Leptidea sinapis TaxID=189913 RepID=A0A5E4QE02_9NEOP|nr:unnamed protein product [Leptidea sinapis]